MATTQAKAQIMPFNNWQGILRQFLPVAVVASTQILSFGFLSSSPAFSQIVPDNTLSVPSQVTIDGNVHTIEGGTEAGSNLFHSFQDFSVPTGAEAFFNNAATVENILTRVTGGNVSHIDGLIRANGTANLFLLNPNGLVFGPNARLDIGGSFFGSTANSIQLSDGSFFSATDPQAPPLLTINVPVGLQFAGNSGTVEVQGEGPRLATVRGMQGLIDRSSLVPNLEVSPGRTLALIGTSVNLTGSTVSALDGQLELSSPRTGTVALTPQGEGWDFNYTDISAWGDVRLSQQALADASGDRGSLRVRAGNFELRDGSLLLLENRGATPQAGGIRIEAADTVLATGTTANGRFASGIVTQTRGEGKGADVAIEADRLTLERGAIFQSVTVGAGNAGAWQANVRSRIEIAGASPINGGRSTWSVVTRGDGSAGDITLANQRLRLVDGGFMRSRTEGSGRSGNISIAADWVELTGNLPEAIGNPNIIVGSIIGVSSLGTGDAGDIEIDTARLILSDGGRLNSAGFAEGDGGNIVISATEEIDIRGRSRYNQPSRLNASVGPARPRLRQQFGLPDIPSGRAGNIVIDTPNLRVSDGAVIAVANRGIQDAGTLQIRANAIRLDNEGVLTADTTSGEGGNIVLDTQTLQLRGGSLISTEAGGTGNGGNIAINTETLALLEDSNITANAFEGQGGNIQIETQGLFLSPNSGITPS
ncbi:MAG: filamentous hemagglutinin N-terminal domain-containing protein [Cyanobacteria bacterium SID2]|nr:filamentous hemagglutinin N-terminal domain-containing protein [Cyanobacteria bacterium SID2]MBP0004024.1 filamentous hemagglutinin N-terminal domain-containing protein [Cyanobacteria bacterium SBC]